MLPRRHRFSPSSTEFKAALRLVFTKREQTVSGSGDGPSTAASSDAAQARANTEPRGVEGEQVREENGHAAE